MPWFLVALIAVVAIVGLLALLPTPDIENARASKLGDFQFPRAEEGDPWPIIYGRVKLKAPNTLWYGNFRTEAITERVRVGLFKKKTITKGYKYYIGMALGLCLGDNVTLHAIFAGKDRFWTGTRNGNGVGVTLNSPGLFGGEDKGGGISGQCQFYSGGNNQSVNPYLASHTDGADTTRMPMKCWISMNQIYVGTSTNIKPFFFELSRYSNSLALGGGIERIGNEMNPVEILYDIMTNKFARRGLATASIDTVSWRAAAQTVFDEGNGMSLKIESPNQAGEVVAEILRQIDGIMYQDPATGRIVLKLIRDDYDETLLPEFTEDTIDDVTDFTKTLWEDTVNQARVEFVDRSQDYTKRPVIEQDMANINFQQSVRSTEIRFPGVYDKALAQRLARRELSAVSIPIFRCNVRVNRKAQLLRPGDPFLLTWPDLGLNRVVMRVRNYNLGTLDDGRISFQAVQDKFSSLTTAFDTPVDSGWTPVTNQPSDVINARMWRAPQFFADGFGINDRRLAVIFGIAERQDQVTLTYDLNTTQGAESVTALDDVLFSQVGVLVDAMPADPAKITTLNVNSITAVGSATNAELKQGQNLALVGDELVAFEVGLDTGLTGVHRGILGTPVQAHAAGTRIFLLEDLQSLSDNTFEEGVQISGEYLSESATAKQEPGGGVTLTYTPPVVAKAESGVSDIAVSTDIGGNNVPVGAATISWSGHGALDRQILLTGEPYPVVPIGTTYNLQVFRGANLVVNETGLTGSTFAHTFLDDGADDTTIIVTPVTNGVNGVAHTENFQVFSPDVVYLNNDWTAFDDQGPVGRTTTLIGTPVLDNVLQLNGENTLQLDGTEAVHIDGTSSVGSIANSNDFTWEAWIRCTDLSHQNTIIGKRDGGGAEEGRLTLISGTGVLQFASFRNGSANDVIASNAGLAANTWYHVAVVRASNVLTLYVDGVAQTQTATQSQTPSANGQNLYIGDNVFNSGRRFEGNMGPVRISISAKYTSNFTPPTTL